jgi:phage protein D
MNDENENNGPVEGETAEMREALIVELQEELEQIQEEFEAEQEAHMATSAALNGLLATPAEAAAPAGDAELRALAVTVRTAQRSGHPDAGKHLDALLTALGAV